MNFAEAWDNVLNGGSVRRRSWDNGYFWFIQDGKVMERTDMWGDERFVQVGQATDNELLATDWEIYQ